MVEDSEDLWDSQKAVVKAEIKLAFGATNPVPQANLMVQFVGALALLELNRVELLASSRERNALA